MRLAVLSAVLLIVSCSSEAKASEDEGVSKRFLLADVLVNTFVDSKYKKEECILCKCFKECHSASFHVNEERLCKNYRDSITCSEIDRCTCCNDLAIFKSCENGGTCRNVGHGNFTCDCLPGHYGHRCELKGAPQQQSDYCASTPCMNGGTCSNGQNGFACQCPNGWTGKQCDIDINECATGNPCQNGATCTNTQGKYSCKCKAGWSGTNCDIDIDECATNNICQNGGTCTNTQGKYSCSCSYGWGGPNCETDSLLECDHACSLEAVVKSQSIGNKNASLCPGTSSRTSNEALPMQCCGIGSAGTWRTGLQVLQHCNDNTVPPYTPISEVVNGKLVPGRAGIFTSCLSDGSGFKMILQDCNTTPSLIQVNGVNGNDPGNYLVIY